MIDQWGGQRTFESAVWAVGDVHGAAEKLLLIGRIISNIEQLLHISYDRLVAAGAVSLNPWHLR
jgi:hypothetical protein